MNRAVPVSEIARAEPPLADEHVLRDTIAAGLRRWPSAGVAVAVVRDSSPFERYLRRWHASAAAARRHVVPEAARLAEPRRWGAGIAAAGVAGAVIRRRGKK